MRMRKKSASVIALFAMLMAVMIPQTGAFAGADGETDDESSQSDDTSQDDGSPDDGTDDGTEEGESTEKPSSDDESDGTEEEGTEEDGSSDGSTETEELDDEVQTFDTQSVETQIIGGGNDAPCPSTDGWTKKESRTSSDVLSSFDDASLRWSESWGTGQVHYDLPDGGSLELCIKGGDRAFGSLFGGYHKTWGPSTVTGKSTVSLNLGKKISHVAWRYTPPEPVCTSYTTAQLRDALKASSVSGGTATLGGIPDDACDDIRISFSSYALPGGEIRPFSEQVLYDHVSKVVTADDNGSTLHVDLPDCGWQTDLYIVDRSVNPDNWTDDHAYHPLKDHEGHPGSILVRYDYDENAGPCFEVDVTAECVYLIGKHAIVSLDNPTGLDIPVLGSHNLIDAPSVLAAGETVLVKAPIGKHGWIQTAGGKVHFNTKNLDLCGADVTPIKKWVDDDGEGDAGVKLTYKRQSVGVGGSVFVPYGKWYVVTEDEEIDFTNVDGLGWFKLKPADSSLEKLIERPTREHVVTNEMKPEADVDIRSICLLKESLFQHTTIYEVVNNGPGSVSIDVDGETVELEAGESYLLTSNAGSVTASWGGAGTEYQQGSATAKGTSKRCGEWVTPEKEWTDEGDHGDAGVTVRFGLKTASVGEQVFVPYGFLGTYLVTEDLPIAFTNDSGLGLFKLAIPADLADIADEQRVHTHTVVNTPKPEIELELDARCVYLPGDEDGYGIVTVTNPGDGPVLFSFTAGGPAGNAGPYLLQAGQTRYFQVDSEDAVAIAWGGLFSIYAPGSADADFDDAVCGAEVTPVKGWDSDDEVEVDVNLTLTHGEGSVGEGDSLFVPFGGQYTVSEDAGPWIDLHGLGDFTLELEDLGIDADDLAGISADDLVYEHHVLNDQLFPSISLVKSADETEFTFGEDEDTSYEVTYTYVITNDGDLPLDALTLIDDITTLGTQVDLTAELTGALDDAFGTTVLGVGDSVEVEMTATYDAATDPAQIDNTATVTGFDPFETEVSDSDDESISSIIVLAEVEEEPEAEPEEEPEVERVAVTRPVEETRVLGTTLARTGGSIVALLIGGLLALFAGGGVLRRRRDEG